MKLLILDQLRRFWSGYLIFMVLVVAIWLSPLAYMADPSFAIAASLMIAYGLGPIASVSQYGVKEIGLLPVSRQARWRALWVLSAIVSPLIVGAGKVVAFGIARHWESGTLAAPELIAVSTLCDFANAGAGTSVLILFGRTGRAAASKTRQVLDASIVLLAMLGGPTLGFVLHGELPQHFADFRGAAGLVVATAIAIGIATWFYSPGSGGQPGVVFAARPQPRTRTVTPLPRDDRAPHAIASLVRLVASKSALLAVAMLALVAFVRFVDGIGADNASSHIGVGPYTVGFLIVGGGDWRQRLRQLRLLPISTMHLTTAILATSVSSWLMAAGALNLLHQTVPRFVPAIPAVTMCLMIGLSALSESSKLRWQWMSHGFGRLVTAIIIVAVVARALQRILSTPGWPAALTMCGVSLAVAAVLIYRSLTRSSDVYRPQPELASPFGAPLRR